MFSQSGCRVQMTIYVQFPAQNRFPKSWSSAFLRFLPKLNQVFFRFAQKVATASVPPEACKKPLDFLTKFRQTSIHKQVGNAFFFPKKEVILTSFFHRDDLDFLDFWKFGECLRNVPTSANLRRIEFTSCSSSAPNAATYVGLTFLGTVQFLFWIFLLRAVVRA